MWRQFRIVTTWVGLYRLETRSLLWPFWHRIGNDVAETYKGAEANLQKYLNPKIYDKTGKLISRGEIK